MMMIVIITKKIVMIEKIIMMMMMMVMNMGAETPLAEIKDMMTLWSSGSVTFAMFPNPAYPL